ncbi:hypothetical protein C8J57DRAFT_1338274 [Mycena rebaudengoi]|nr:hypothetical protein C8J57DRAFT_1338274 [Mycena rebaudengoi]
MFSLSVLALARSRRSFTSTQSVSSCAFPTFAILPPIARYYLLSPAVEVGTCLFPCMESSLSRQPHRPAPPRARILGGRAASSRRRHLLGGEFVKHCGAESRARPKRPTDRVALLASSSRATRSSCTESSAARTRLAAARPLAPDLRAHQVSHRVPSGPADSADAFGLAIAGGGGGGRGEGDRSCGRRRGGREDWK